MSFSPWVWERDTAEASYCALGRCPFYGQDVNSSSLGWAMSAASSRAFRLHGEIPMLLPLIDMCNHSFNPNARIVQEGSVNSLDMSVKVSILWCSCTPKFSIYTLLKILFQNQAILFLSHIHFSNGGGIIGYIIFLFLLLWKYLPLTKFLLWSLLVIWCTHSLHLYAQL